VPRRAASRRTRVTPVCRPLPTFRECYAFPLSSPEARRDLLVGGTLLVAPFVGRILNLGHRLEVVGRVCRSDPPYFRGFGGPSTRVFIRGLHAFGAIAAYLSPAVLAAIAAIAALASHRIGSAVTVPLSVLAAVLFSVAVYVLPGGMTYNAAFDDMTYLYRPDKALQRAVAGGAAYRRAWLIAASAIALSPLGLLAFGVGFFYSSVWAWSVVGYAFTRALIVEAPVAAWSCG
jgi:hypothetical protein